MRILVADDDEMSRLLLERALPRLGHEVVAARDGEEAWQALQAAGAPRVALLDWMMPGADGPDLCRRLRGRSGAPYVYVILLTSRSQKDDIVQGLDAGADDYLVKPCTAEQLRASLAVAETTLRMMDAQDRGGAPST